MQNKLIILLGEGLSNISCSKKVNSGSLWIVRLRGRRKGSRQPLFLTFYFFPIHSEFFSWTCGAFIYFNWMINSKKLRTHSTPSKTKPQTPTCLRRLCNTISAYIPRWNVTNTWKLRQWWPSTSTNILILPPIPSTKRKRQAQEHWFTAGPFSICRSNTLRVMMTPGDQPVSHNGPLGSLKATVPTCSGPRQHTGRGAAHFPPSDQSETARGSRTCAVAAAKQEGNRSLLRQKVKW